MSASNKPFAWLEARLPATFDRIEPYVPGKPVDELKRELGLTRIVKLASNENPLGAGQAAREAYAKASEKLGVYPDGAAYDLKQAIVRHHADFGVKAEQIVVGAGSDEVLGMLNAIVLRPGDTTVFGAPSFLMYKLGTLARGAEPIEVPHKGYHLDLDAMAAAIQPSTRMVYLDNPNNPLGTVFTEGILVKLIEKAGPERIVVVDEAYAEFAEAPFTTALRLMGKYPNIMVMRTFSKAYGLAGLRVGYGVMHADLSATINKIRQPFNVSLPAQAAAVAALSDISHLEKTVASNRAGKAQLEAGLKQLGLPFTPSHANFILAEVGDGERVFQAMLREGVIIRSMRSLGLPAHARISIGTAEENEICLAALRKVVGK